MKRKIIKWVIIAIPILLLIKCSGGVDDVLGSQFPLDVNNDGDSIKVHVNEINNIDVKVKAIYLSRRCTTAHLNAAYTKISYSSDKISVKIDKSENNNSVATFTMPINGGGWCNWSLSKIYITPKQKNILSNTFSFLLVNVSDTDSSRVFYDVFLAPVILKYNSGMIDKYYLVSNNNEEYISNYKDGEIEVDLRSKNELLTYSLVDEGVVIFPNGVKKNYKGSGKLTSPEFNEILENSILNEKKNN